MIKFSVVVPVAKISRYITADLIPALHRQTCQDFELIIVPDQKPKTPNLPSWVTVIASWPQTGPADKRDLAAKQAKGRILAFIDDDAYPGQNWLKKALADFDKKNTAGVCGPGLTPSSNKWQQKVSGWVWRTWLGAGGAGVYRNCQCTRQEVDDYPTFNLMVRKKDYQAVGGFDTHFWPGEDTKLCHDLVYKLGKKIIYDPDVFVYHHRRPIFKPHLQQIARFARHRGHFVRILPRTSLRWGYFIPSFFVLGLIAGPFLVLFYWWLIYPYWLALAFYAWLLLLAAFKAAWQEKNLLIGLMLIPAIISTHLLYGVLFIKGLLSDNPTR